MKSDNYLLINFYVLLILDLFHSYNFNYFPSIMLYLIDIMITISKQ
jgi:hypothetical protein